MNLRIFIPVAFVILAVSSCKTSRKTTKQTAFDTTDLRGIEKAVNEQAFEFGFLKIRSTADVVLNGEEQTQLTLQIRMERDKKIWISATALIGIEVGRMLITPDSVHILNHMQREYTGKSLEYLGEFTGASLSIHQIQNLLVGNPVTGYENAVTYLESDSIVVVKKLSNYVIKEFFHPAAAKIVRLIITDNAKPDEANVYYSAMKQNGDKSIPSKVAIFVNTLNNAVSSEFSYFEISSAETLQFPFNVPETYKRN